MIEKAVAARPNSGFIIDSLGWSLFTLGNFEDAIHPMERAVELIWSAACGRRVGSPTKTSGGAKAGLAATSHPTHGIVARGKPTRLGGAFKAQPRPVRLPDWLSR